MKRASDPDLAAPWYDVAFGADYGLVYAHRDVAEARADVQALVERGLVAPFVDLGCGGGRHLAAARELGFAGVGLDRSAEQLAGVPRGLPAVRGDVRALPFADASFACALSLFSSFGYFDAAGDRAHLREAARVLAPGGVLLLDLADPATVRAELVAESRRAVGDWRLCERRWLSEDGRRVRKEVRLEHPERPARGWTEDLALYEPEELERLLDEAGFVPEARWNSLRAAPAAAASGPPAGPRQVLRARRR